MPLGLINLLPLIYDNSVFQQLLLGLDSIDRISLSVIEASKPLLVTALSRKLKVPLLLVTGQPEKAKHFFEQILIWNPNGNIRLFPEPESLPYERLTTDNTAELERLQVLASLVGNNSDVAKSPPMIIASAAALMQKTLSHDEFKSACHEIRVGMKTSPFDLLARWQSIGYRVEPTVDVPGSISHRGGIVDVYPPQSENPVRIEFFGNTIDSIRTFEPASQRSLQHIPGIRITPATELPLSSERLRDELSRLDISDLSPDSKKQFESDLTALVEGHNPGLRQFYAPFFNHTGLLDYFTAPALIVIDEPDTFFEALAELESEAGEIRTERLQQHLIPAVYPFPLLTGSGLRTTLDGYRTLSLAEWGVDPDRRSFPFKPAPGYAGQTMTFVQKIKEMTGQRKRVIVISNQAGRLAELLEEQEVPAPVRTDIKETPPLASLTLVQGLLGEGWVLNDETFLFTDTEIFGFTKQRRFLRRRPVPRARLSIDITPGNYVVHVEHGIAKLLGVTTMTTREGEKEYLVLEYAAGDKLYVPADQIDRVTRYIGAGDRPPALSRLGTQEWFKTRQKVNEAVEKVAKELLALYATREVVPGYAFSRDTVWQQEMEASFPYIETPDQLTVQAEVKEDMENSKPMDRLVCGDVGYGKTEIAVRAAFKAVMDHKQVAVLVPTTVLAEQHYVTFSQRFSAFPVKVEVLSRFRTHRQQQTIIDGLADGTVDVCIGTHRVIQKDVGFKNLGLLIIDEEQRFGVAHKEFLKKIRHEVDVLALSATPIPRTLHMSLVGVRDMSVMETPPEDRLPVKTYVAPYEDRLVKEAIIRELDRNGQVFFLHNRVQSIDFIASKLQTLVPEARFTVAHGQMNEDELNQVMTDFVQGKADVLVCTTIIESGLDMPNVNTLIVNQSDRFGLSQLYQLRGRVGRGANTAYSYFLYDKGKRLTEIAEKRLQTIFEATELGAGFGIAMKDLEIRGAGNLLGVRQSGHISAVGFSLYTQLLSRAVEELKARRAGVPEEKVKAAHLPPPTIDLPLPSFIPEEYVEDLNTRIALYQKLVKLDKIAGIDSLRQEFTDRFGALPKEVDNLLYAVKIKLIAAQSGIESVAMDESEIVLRRFEGMRFDREKMEPFLKGLRLPLGSLRFDPLAIRLNTKRTGATWPKVLEDVLRRAG
jgi:transcription-repair coupling factor (superfamily II helicase)